MISTPEVLSVVIPAFNEKNTLARVVEKVHRLECLLEIVIVDDCSTDGTHQEAERLAGILPKVRVLHHSRNQGKTAALKTGIAATKGDVIIIQDADLEYDPEDIPIVIQPIVEGR